MIMATGVDPTPGGRCSPVGGSFSEDVWKFDSLSTHSFLFPNRTTDQSTLRSSIWREILIKTIETSMQTAFRYVADFMIVGSLKVLSDRNPKTIGSWCTR